MKLLLASDVDLTIKNIGGQTAGWILNKNKESKDGNVKKLALYLSTTIEWHDTLREFGNIDVSEVTAQQEVGQAVSPGN